MTRATCHFFFVIMSLTSKEIENSPRPSEIQSQRRVARSSWAINYCVTQKRRSLDRKRTHLKALLAFCSPSAAITLTTGIGDHQCYNYDYFQHVLRFHCKCNSNHRHHHLHNHHALIILTNPKSTSSSP